MPPSARVDRAALLAASHPRQISEELLLAARARHPHARAQFVESFMPLINSIARIYRYVPAVERPELIQEGVVGVLRALERYDPELGAPFCAYASWWIRQAMQRLVAELSRPVVLSDRALRQLARARGARRTFIEVNAREPSMQELAAASGLSVDQLQRLAAADRQPRGLDEPLHEISEGGTTLGDLLCDPRAEEAFEELTTCRVATDIPRLLERVNQRERMVVNVRYGLEGRRRTLRELGESLGVSTERVRQIEQEALEKMRAA